MSEPPKANLRCDVCGGRMTKIDVNIVGRKVQTFTESFLNFKTTDGLKRVCVHCWNTAYDKPNIADRILAAIVDGVFIEK